jgi:hypothetical protein
MAVSSIPALGGGAQHPSQGHPLVGRGMLQRRSVLRIIFWPFWTTSSEGVLPGLRGRGVGWRRTPASRSWIHPRAGGHATAASPGRVCLARAWRASPDWGDVVVRPRTYGGGLAAEPRRVAVRHAHRAEAFVPQPARGEHATCRQRAPPPTGGACQARRRASGGEAAHGKAPI